MQKEKIIEQLKLKGYRITNQRKAIVDIILENECSCCKEIYYKALTLNQEIGIATIYRMVNTLEEIGAISRKNMYKISCSEHCERKCACTVVLDDETTYHLTQQRWNDIIKAGLTACGYCDKQEISAVVMGEHENDMVLYPS